MQRIREYCEIIIPKALSPKNALKTANFIGNISNYKKYCYNFTHLEHCPPLGLLIILNAIRSNMKRYPEAEHYPLCKINSFSSGITYAAHLGLFQACNWDVGRKTNWEDQTSKCLPITLITMNDLNNFRDESKNVQGQIEYFSRLLAIRLTQDTDYNLTTVLKYCLREIIRNTFEHSGTDRIWVCGQYWPTRKRTELAFMDEGCGILHTIQQNPHYHATTDIDAIKLALQPGVTRTFGTIETNDIWQNSGYGLYVTSSLCLLGGHFVLGSGQSAIFLNPEGSQEYQTALNGTTVCLSLDIEKIPNINALLEKIVAEGERKAESYKDRILSASKVSSIASILDKIH